MQELQEILNAQPETFNPVRDGAAENGDDDFRNDVESSYQKSRLLIDSIDSVFFRKEY